MAQTAGGGEEDEDPDEVRLFRDAVRDVKPLPAPGACGRPPQTPAAGPLHARRSRRGAQGKPRGAPVPSRLTAARSSPIHRPGIQPAVLRKLRRGEYRVQARSTCTGSRSPKPSRSCGSSSSRRCEAQVRCVRIIHGKGLRSGARGPVLKAAVGSVLRRSGAVLACVSARPADGGTGAVYVLLAGL